MALGSLRWCSLLLGVVARVAGVYFGEPVEDDLVANATFSIGVPRIIAGKESFVLQCTVSVVRLSSSEQLVRACACGVIAFVSEAVCTLQPTTGLTAGHCFKEQDGSTVDSTGWVLVRPTFTGDTLTQDDFLAEILDKEAKFIKLAGVQWEDLALV